MNFKTLIVAVILAVAVSFSPNSHAQSSSAASCTGLTTSTNTGTTSGIVSEDFTCKVTSQQWFFFNGACLTAGTASDTASTPVNPGVVPGCAKVMTSYYNVANYGGVSGKNADAALVGGEYGYLGSTTAPSSATGVVPDDNGSGALRFTNGSPYGKQERGAIVSNYTFPTGQGVHITFKTAAYLGSADGPLSDGADGISFFLMDGCVPIAGGTVPSNCPANPIYGTGQTFPAIGATGGSLAYSCSNSNSPYDGLVGAYIGLGMDEWGNFLNGASNTLGESGTSATSDNTATGGGYKSGRIGLRGAGSISWQALTTAYGTNNGSSSPYYPSSLTACSSGTSYNGQCASCSGGTFSNGSCTGTGSLSCSSGTLSGSSCLSCSSGTLNTSTGNCDNVCSAGTYVSGGSNPGCYSCSGSGTPKYKSSSGTYSCGSGGGTISGPTSTTSVAAASTAATQAQPSYSATAATLAVKNTCSTGKLYNYSTPSSPVAVGNADLNNSVNTAKIMDYAALYYSVIPTPSQDPVNGFLIANESATTRGAAQPIFYDLKVTQDGLMSLSYSYNGGTAVPVISNQKITTSNGPLPSSFRFGFAGSTGGSTNVHEILCFKAAPVETSGSSGAINVYHNPYVRTGTQIFIANYFPSDWTGQLEAFGITNGTGGAPTIAQVNWDARCVLSGLDSASGLCDSTGQASPSSGQTPSSRVMLTWDPSGRVGEAFEWTSLTTTQQSTLTAGDATQTSNRVAYLRGDTTNEINSSGVGLYRKRGSILSDIVDSSPDWIGPPQNPYTLISSWVDQLNPLVTQPENASGAQTYAQYMAAYDATKNPNGALGRENVVYAGANDGFLHGFRAGALDVNGNLDTSTYPNDGQEVLAYMPSAVLNNIHPVDSSGNVISQLDFSNSQYSHNWFVDATPAQGDVFYGSKWHTWVVSGLGPGGAAMFALDVTDPTQFSEANAKNIVIGEWSPSNLTCPNQTVTACGVNLGNTYGAPQIRRFHNGQWGFVFGNGYGTANGASGIYIALLDKTSGAPTFYWFPTNLTFRSTTPNGISYVYSADLDLDNTADYIYAGDLLGNVWRFDVTSNSPSNWGVSASSPLFNAGQPITTQVIAYTVKTITTTVNAVGLDVSNAPQRVVVIFGTGRQIPQTLSSAALYASGTESIYGIWDWDMGVAGTSGWNNISANQKGIGLTSSPGTITTSNLQSQTLAETPMVIAANGSTTGGTATLTHNVVCWSGGTACSSGNTKLGWYTTLPSTNEQIIFNPLADPNTGTLTFNTYIPANTSVLSCTQNGATGFSLGIDPGSGGGLTLPLFNIGGTSYDGVQTNAAGAASVINSGTSGGGKFYLVTHNTNGNIAFTQMNLYNVTTGRRVYWIQKR